MKTKTMQGYMSAVIVALLLTLFFASPAAQAKKVKLDVSVGTPKIMADQIQKAYIRIALQGYELEDGEYRAPVNVAIVLDKSGSMQGEKIQQAKEAAIMAIERLRADDIVSVITYDTNVRVVVPATKVSDRHTIYAAIRNIQPGGSTALFAGVSKGAAEVRKFLKDERVNRIVLLSDGLANVGPSSPGQLAELGTSLGAEGISVTTIGLGINYNEDLMTQLAQNSDGNHIFAENAQDLKVAFQREFGDVMSVVAKNVVVTITFPENVRPIRILGRNDGNIGRETIIPLNQLYSEHVKYLVFEVELPPATEGEKLDVASVEVSYSNLSTKTNDRLAGRASVIATTSSDEVKKNENVDVMIAVAQQIGLENNERALELRDKGQIEEARKVLITNAVVLRQQAQEYNSEALKLEDARNSWDAKNLDPDKWQNQRKVMRESQQSIKSNRPAGGKNIIKYKK